MTTGNTNENISVSLQPALIKRLEKYCFKKDLQKSQVVARSLRRFLASDLADNPEFWDQFYDKYDEESKF